MTRRLSVRALSPSAFTRMRRLPAIALVMATWCLSWAVLFACVRPAGQNFPLLDDFSFTRGALGFARAAGIRYDGWPGIPLLGQWAWAAPFVWLLGETHVATRVSTLVLAGLALIAFFSLLRSERIPPPIAAFATATLAFNPWFYLLSGTYMTDVPSLAFALIALALLRKGLDEGSGALWGLGTLVTTLAVINRQNMLAVPIAALVLLLRRSPQRPSPWWLLAIAIPLAVGPSVAYWFSQRSDIQRLMLRVPGGHLLDLAFGAAHTIGLGVLPAGVLLPEVRSSRTALTALLALALLAASSLYHGAVQHYATLVLGNVITLRGAFTSIGGLEVGGGPLRDAVLLLGGYAGIAIVIARAPRLRIGGTAAMLLLVFTLLQVPPLLVTMRVYDRYLLLLLPAALLAVVAGRSTSRPRWVLALVLLAAAALASVGLTHDLLELNRARWELGRRAVASGIPPTDIDAGFEWAGWFNLVRTGDAAERTMPQIRGPYRIVAARAGAAGIVDSEPYQLWMASGARRLFLVKARM